jgi:hypothetical protein
MPNAYAHYRLGWEVFPRLSPALRTVIEAKKDLFQAGFYGPDIFFYYKPFTKTPVGRLGTTLHRRPAKKFFRQAKTVLQRLPDRKAAEAYLQGYVTHFALDSCCHSYVEYMVEQNGMDHSEIETDLERELLVRDGLDPVRHHAVAHLGNITLQEAELIAAVHRKLSPPEAMEAVSSMYRFSRLLLPTNPVKRRMIDGVLRLSGQYEALHGLLIRKEPAEQLRKTTKELLACYEEAVPMAVELMENYHGFLWGKAPLSKLFDHGFDGDEREKERIEERISHD